MSAIAEVFRTHGAAYCAAGEVRCSFAVAKLPAVRRGRTAVIQDLVEIRGILARLVKTGGAPPGLDPGLLN